ncbi:PREDICTED: NADH dehydrogenase [ubiquinone] iron-sulfur protein 4, mitochondrial-like [Amphimedon queenslandica]|uniref:NADH dehydrogenase [ubiquinone] iron-sulfur protein 4, mitochondrial n=1 Tax=Amphimedon queenslandica TaxID=400682 RepID=A0A1X7TCM5_AMPQE|nr:PREDICTED: NADH dehydrogenase [ubiquinone] iron-sulfur protein 4, mitochondrial-like [Amphimedon queenslandica]|eukprot:XP_003390778.1 PREDICTED: NADH dehydrogenase [ubiquinone] iron-sulfur protein 4, mitochondrial-like [Amphimedon queenslandica]
MAVRRLLSLWSVNGSRLTGLRVAYVSTDPKPATSLVKKEREDIERMPADKIPTLQSVSGLPDDEVGRLVRIYRRSKNAMQSGTNNTHQWTMEFDNQERWENPLMGWTSTGDPNSNVIINFDSKEQAIAFAVQSGFKYQVTKEQLPITRRKSYGDNFSWDKRTRVGSK